MAKKNRLLVLSDNHGSSMEIENVFEEFHREIDAVVHCGDSEWSPEILEDMAGCPVYCAKGNCDSGFLDKEETLFEFGDHTCLVTHGHFYGVNWGTDMLVDKAVDLGADIVFYGHTHIPDYQTYEEEGVTLMNPGSIAQPRQSKPQRTFMIVELEEDGSIRPQFYHY